MFYSSSINKETGFLPQTQIFYAIRYCKPYMFQTLTIWSYSLKYQVAKIERLKNRKIQEYLKQLSFCKKQDFIIPISLQPDT